jgi:D-beta-D-heptose 7-phosphate kinase/D-beta-D-heptose 1-phosphate adenosyltransferase
MTKVIVNGTFDILHVGHVQMLNYAKSLGEYLLVAIDTDQRVQELKGASRPINNQEDRKCMLLNLKSVDEVVFFNSKEELINIIKEYNPGIMVKGSDYRHTSVIGQANIPQVVFYDRTEHSTTRTIQNIIDRG